MEQGFAWSVGVEIGAGGEQRTRSDRRYLRPLLSTATRGVRGPPSRDCWVVVITTLHNWWRNLDLRGGEGEIAGTDEGEITGADVGKIASRKTSIGRRNSISTSRKNKISKCRNNIINGSRRYRISRSRRNSRNSHLKARVKSRL